MRLFISYAHVDKAIVKNWVVSKLIAGGHDVWFDDRLVAGQDWKQQLSEEIERSAALVYCMTPESVTSDWCQWELARSVDLGKPVIPVLMQAQTLLPDQLKKLQHVDFSDGPTGDAVARLMGGLQHLSPAQIPPAPADPKGKPAQETEQNGKTGMKYKEAYIAGAFVILAAIITGIFGLWQGAFNNSGSSSDQTSNVAQVTPVTLSTPRITAIRNMDIRNGPGTNFDRIAVLNTDDHLDILGISEDNRWYQVLLPDGNTGWVVTASSAGEVSGPLGALAVIVMTETPTATSIQTSAPLVTVTLELTLMPVNTVNPTEAGTILPNLTPGNPTKSYPCEGRIIAAGSDASVLRIVQSQPPPNSIVLSSVYVNQLILLVDSKTTTNNGKWIRISELDGTRLGWVPVEYVSPSLQCPE